MHRELAVFDLPGGAGVLALHSDGVQALLQITCLVDQQNPVRVPEPGRDEIADVAAYEGVVPTARPRRSRIPPGPSSPACSAIVQQFLTGSGASSPVTKSRTRRRGSGRAKRAWIVSINSLNSSDHR